jgi:hypothetical protein
VLWPGNTFTDAAREAFLVRRSRLPLDLKACDFYPLLHA